MIDLDLNLVKVFYVVAKDSSITKASKELFISQPAVSQSIKKLEQELGGTLFYRSNKGIKLTEEGKIFFDYVKDSFEYLQKGKQSFCSYKNLQSGVVNIGISTILTKIVLKDVLKKFSTLYPLVKLNIINEASPKLVEGLQKGLYDFVIINKAENSSGLVECFLQELKLCFVCNPKFYDFDSINLQNLANLPLILQNKNSHTRKLFDEFVSKNNIKINPKLEVASQELVKFMATEGMGVGLVFDSDIGENLVKLKTDFDLPINKIVFLENTKNIQSFASQKFKELLFGDKKNDR